MRHHTIDRPPGKTPSLGEIASADLRRAIADAAATIDAGLPLGNVQLITLARLCLAVTGGAR